MKIAIVGAGGAGGYFGGRWAQAGLDVTLVARGRHLEAIRSSGLRIESPLGSTTIPVRAAAPHEEVGPVDLVVVATKFWQLQGAVESVRRSMDSSTSVLGLQNGVEAAEVLAGAVGRENVLGGTCRIISFIEEPGVIRHVGADPTVVFGELTGGVSDRAAEFESALHLGSTVEAVASEDILVDIWRKFLFFAPVSGVGSVTRAPIGVFRTEAETRRLLESAVREVRAVATASGIDLPPESVADALAFIDTLPAAGTSSMQRDFEAGRRTELEALSGAVVRLGREHRVPTPTHEYIYSSLLPLERRARGALEW